MKPISVLRVFFAIAVPAAAWAQASLPTGANVVAGSATISATANSMTVATGSQRTIIDYSGFNVGTGNSVRFNQPSTSSATLNRVISTEGSAILGSVSSNGQIFLVNPNGIFVGAGGSFSGSGIYLSTGNISNADFLGGNIRFDPPPEGNTIRVAGRIDATDDIRLYSNIVDSPGILSAGGSIFIDSTGISNTVSPDDTIISSLPTLAPGQGGIVVISGTGSGGNLVLTGGINNSSTAVFLTSTVQNSNANLAAAPAPLPTPAARTIAPSIPRGTSGLVDGTVTVRLSLVDAAPISLR